MLRFRFTRHDAGDAKLKTKSSHYSVQGGQNMTHFGVLWDYLLREVWGRACEGMPGILRYGRWKG